MKKFVIVILLFCLAVLSGGAVATAGPAPALSKVNINAFTAQNYDYQWQFAPANYHKNMGDYLFSGSELYMAVVFTGQPNWNLTFIKVNGNQYKHSQLSYKQFPLTDRGGIVGGYEIIYKIPATGLGGSNTIIVNSYGTTGGSGDSIATDIKFKK